MHVQRLRSALVTLPAFNTTHKPFPKLSTSNQTKLYGDKIVSNLWGPSPIESMRRKKYYLMFQDGFTHEERIYFLEKKSEAMQWYQKYKAWVSTQWNAKIKILGTDRGGEFTSDEFKDHLEKAGTVRHLTVHDSPQSNGKAERANCTVMDGVRAMLLALNLPKFLWAEAASHHIWLRNCVPTHALPKSVTPLEMATGQHPDLSMVHEWGCRVWVKRFDEESKGCRIYWEAKRSVTVERDIYFDEREVLNTKVALIEGERNLPSTQCPKYPPKVNQNDDTCTSDEPVRETDERNEKSVENAPNRALDDENPSETERDIVNKNLPPPDNPYLSPMSQPSQPIANDQSAFEPSRGHQTQARKAPGYYRDLMKGRQSGRQPGGVELTDVEHELAQPAINEIESDDDELFAGIMGSDVALTTGCEPKSLKEALSGNEAKLWRNAVEAELTQIEKLNTWEIMEALPDANIVSSKYVFRYKHDESGRIIKHKAHLVTRGFTQKFGVDYFDTCVWIIRWETLQNLLSHVATRGSAIHQANMKNAYLNAEINEDIYVDLPPDYRLFHPLPPNPSG
ncbi:hypothetical protein AX17_005074 [Amanita inopinata Kibby_2008]|nr:hypothetical protein AX17_005074 [Amanita inopinata Kibby_2008]